jgi:hypothetical protein
MMRRAYFCSGDLARSTCLTRRCCGAPAFGAPIQSPVVSGAITAPLFKYLTPGESAEESLVSQKFASWNRMADYLRRLDALRWAAA